LQKPQTPVKDGCLPNTDEYKRKALFREKIGGRATGRGAHQKGRALLGKTGGEGACLVPSSLNKKNQGGQKGCLIKKISWGKKVRRQSVDISKGKKGGVESWEDSVWGIQHVEP